ncbi:unnamed protein product [Ophioblennius macclurei]
MGAQLSKTGGKAQNVAASPCRSNGQENGHVKANGDASIAVAENGKEGVQANGSTTAEGTSKEDGAVATEKADAAPVEKLGGEGEKVEEEASASNETPKKKKKFSFKKSFRLSGFSFKKTKKETGDCAETEEAVPAAEGEAKPEKNAEEAATEPTEEVRPTDGEVEPVTEQAKVEAKVEAKPEEATPVDALTTTAEAEKLSEPQLEKKPSETVAEEPKAEEVAPASEEATTAVEPAPAANTEAAAE